MVSSAIRLATIPSLLQELAEMLAQQSVKQSKQPRDSYDKWLLARISIWRGDITQLEVDMIVNFTDSRMSGSHGTDAEMHEAAGPAMTKACKALGRIGEGETKVTIGYKLPARFVAHTVPPQLSDFGHRSNNLLACCLRAPLTLCEEYGQKSIAIPCIISNLDNEDDVDISRVAVQTVTSFLKANMRNTSPLDRVVFVARTDAEEDMYRAMAAVQLSITNPATSIEAQAVPSQPLDGKSMEVVG